MENARPSAVDIPMEPIDLLREAVDELFKRDLSFEKVLDCLFTFMLQLTGAQLVVYRRYVPEDENLILTKHRWADDPDLQVIAANFKIPPVKRMGHGVGTIFKAGIVSDVQSHERHQAGMRSGRYDDWQEQLFLQWIGHEAWLPICAFPDPNGTLQQGILVAFRGTDQPAFDNTRVTEAFATLQGFLNVLFALGVLQQKRMEEQTITRLSSVLPILAGAEDNSAFWRGFITVLTAHVGLQWHRAAIFLCDETDVRADCVMAVGGVGEVRWTARQSELEVKHAQLPEMTRSAMHDLKPGESADGSDVDPLYEVLAGNDHVSYRTVYGGAISNLFHLDSTSGPTEGFVRLGPRDPWIDEIRKREVAETSLSRGAFNALFPDEHEWMAFPLETQFDGTHSRPRVLGFVLLDMRYSKFRTDPRAFDPDRGATRFVLDTLANLVAMRRSGQEFLKMWSCLGTFEHDLPKLTKFSRQFESDYLPSIESSAANMAGECFQLLKHSIERLEREYRAIKQIVQAQRRSDCTKDVYEFFHGQVTHWKEQYQRLEFDLDFPGTGGPEVVCHSRALREICESILENADGLAAARPQGKVKVFLSVDIDDVFSSDTGGDDQANQSRSKKQPKVVCVTLATLGLSIPSSLGHRALMAGISTRSEGTGLGLFNAALKLQLYGGTLRIAAFRPTTFHLFLLESRPITNERI